MTAPAMTPAQVAARVAEIIRTRPELYDQRQWWDTPRRFEEGEVHVAEVLAALEGGEPCGTTCCVAGWAAALTAPPRAVFEAKYISSGVSWQRIDRAAAQALGIPWPEDRTGLYETLWLFETERTRDEVLAELDRIAGGQP